MLLNNDAFICAIFLDGRINATLAEHQQLNAKRKLLDLHLHLQYLNTDKENLPPSSSTSDSQTETDSARTLLEDFLSTKYVEAQSDIQNLIRLGTDNMRPHGFKNLDDEIAMFLKEPLLKSTENILNHWGSKKKHLSSSL
ncbi:unnamed protein product [Parnassius apollo]|nr:unnamed protein product [Parnassius apollo]